MSQRNWIILAVVVIVLVIGYLFWPGTADDAVVAPTDVPETMAPADEPETTAPADESETTAPAE